MTIDDFKALLEQRGPVVRDGGDWRGRCPAHSDDGQRGDLTFRQSDGKIVLHCWGGCSAQAVVTALGLQWSDLFSENGHSKAPAAPRPKKVYPAIHQAVDAIGARLGGSYVADWTYHDAGGEEVLYVVRFDGCKTLDGKKSYRPVHPVPGGFVEGDPQGPLPLYRLPKLLADTSSLVFVLEGEKAVDAGISIGLLCTTSAHGSSSPRRTDWTPLAGRECIILPDHDSAGEGYADTVAQILSGLNPPATVKIVRLPGLPEAGDLYDYIEHSECEDAGTIRANVLVLAAQTDAFTQPTGSSDKEPAQKIEVVNASDWLTTEPPAPDQILADAFDRGDKVAIIGSSKLRKSFFLLQGALSLASGRDFLGWSVPKARRVFVVQLEIQRHHFHRRFKRMAAALELTQEALQDRFQIVNGRGLALAGAGGIEAIKRAVLPFGPDLICIDPLYKINTGAENAAEDMKTVLGLFDQLAEQTGAAVLYVHHDAKGFSGDRDIRDRGSGSGVLGRDYDACFTLTPHATEDDAVVVETLLRNYRPQEASTIGWVDDLNGGYCFGPRSDLAPTKKTSANARGREAIAFDTCFEVAETMLSAGPMEIRDFKGCLREKTGLSRDRTNEFVRWALQCPEGALDVHSKRGRGQNDKWIGLPDQIAKLRETQE